MYNRTRYLSIASVSVVPLALLAYGLWLQGKRPVPWHLDFWWTYGLMAFGVLVIMMRFSYVRNHEDEELRDIRSELSFFFKQGTSALSFGGGLASVIAGLYFLFPVHGELHHRFEAAFGIYTAIVGITLTAHAFYSQAAPMTDVNLLLKRLIEDLNHCQSSGRLWIIYPALNIGFYRNYLSLRGAPPRENVVMRFRDSLQACSERLGRNAKAITFPLKYYSDLYKAYEEMATESKGGEDSMTRVSECVSSAKLFIRRFCDHGGEPSEVRTLDPYGFPPHVIVVENTIYLISTFGLPQFVPGKAGGDGTFKAFPGDHHSVALLVAHRREDAAAANTLCAELSRFWDDAQPIALDELKWETNPITNAAAV